MCTEHVHVVVIIVLVHMLISECVPLVYVEAKRGRARLGTSLAVFSVKLPSFPCVLKISGSGTLTPNTYNDVAGRAPDGYSYHDKNPAISTNEKS